MSKSEKPVEVPGVELKIETDRVAPAVSSAEVSVPQVSVGRVVSYRLSEGDVGVIRRKRRAAADYRRSHPTVSSAVQLHGGNSPVVGDVCAAVVVRVWSQAAINLQVLLDGEDTLWVTSVGQGDGPRQWSWPERV